VVGYLQFLWSLLLVFAAAEAVSFGAAAWILALVCFVALREYFSMIKIRAEDIWGLWGAYLAIPFMIVFLQIDWYGMFIISIPVYAFLAIPFLVVLGGKETEGAIFSIGAIDFGLFFLVYCMGHLGYLLLFSTWMAILALLAVAICDVMCYLLDREGSGNYRCCLASMPFTIALALSMAGWAGIPWYHALALGVLIPVLAVIGRFTVVHLEEDLGIRRENLAPGKGRILNSSASLLYVAPILFHYIRYFVQ
jgi:phosphatidate cytidylyltransferase